MVREPNPGSAPFQEDGSENVPFPSVEIYQTNTAEDAVMMEIITIITDFACLETVFPVA
jgi:hypothetical protein